MYQIPAPQAEVNGSLTMKSSVAQQVRDIARAEGRPKAITAIVQDMINAYVENTHPEWRIKKR